MSIATKTGDDGTTALLFRKRVSKTHPRVMTYGRVDELSSALGLCRAFSQDEVTKAAILQIQQQLIHFMGELATDDEDQERYQEKYGKDAITMDMVDRFSDLVKEKEETVTFRGWTFAGETVADAFFDQARTTCRRAERGVVALKESGATIRPELIQYLNRLADLLWLWGREHA
ncbi:cob(I)yrinic acid a,c-diamide adenosyltransferase [Coraliomargarita akajimensis]|uniref:Corrinoid adenosyltransferase n=1 Tax=Coraliomargarita akajimensis (strain DSM 45221 / IAM 15411 / JCM 23193 / KCTC 12865 / 04OKA010-24) TaxID=583355 RepID=D5EQ59_CORAD|nr:cob(I)yrinic acid a,c-diamide adenosyltransferase [Coraliomargarita akajimensis]ADE53827.1 ATP/cobalamin adenosyltransferase [Coraliomargarita akajimensis DSM 45221]